MESYSQHMLSGALATDPMEADRARILAAGAQIWRELRGARILITGGTGFFGCWLLESFSAANERFGLGARMVVLTRDEAAFRAKRPHLCGSPSISLCRGDVRSFAFPKGDFSHVIHAATDAGARLSEEPLLAVDTIVEGTRRVLEFATRCGATDFLLASSGAVYGRQPQDITHVPEEYLGGPDPNSPASAYGEGKRLAEVLGAVYASKTGLKVKIARGFAFVGPYLASETHFAVCDFIGDALRGSPIFISGDGTAVRSYLYGADLAWWLWTILLKGQPGRPYNVGSEISVSIAELARAVTVALEMDAPIRIANTPKPGATPDRYVPSTQRARQELGLKETVSLQEAIRRTTDWHRMNSKKLTGRAR